MVESSSTRASLLIRLKDPRDEQAWTEFVDIYEPLILAIARRRGVRGADADDLAQEVFIAVASAIDRWNSGPSRGSFRAWLFVVARNLTVDLMEARRKHVQGSGKTDARLLLEEIPERSSADSEFDIEYQRRLFGWAAQKVQCQFTDAAWQAFRMSAIEGRSGAEVADALGTTVGTVYYYKSMVMARLRREIERLEDRLQSDREKTGDANEFDRL
jgi:RNA polymerase sigma-70 factor (ECF subfamily)